MTSRCSWAGDDPLYQRYHDEEWGVPVHDDRMLFEFLTLEGFQAGLSWLTILKKREHFREAFDNFDWRRIGGYDARDVERLMHNERIIRNRRKIEATIANARLFEDVRRDTGSFDRFLWQFTDYRTLTPSPRPSAWEELPTQIAESEALSRALKKRGFSFVGPTICYALMQAVGMVDDHLAGCFKSA